MTAYIFTPDLIARLNQSLSDACLSKSTKKAVKWIDMAFSANNGDPNLNQLHAALLATPGNNKITIRDNFEEILVRAFVFDSEMSNRYLDTLWHLISKGSRSSLNAIRLKIEEICQPEIDINFDTSIPQHCLLMHLLLEDSEDPDANHIFELAEIIHSQHKSKDVTETLSALTRLNPNGIHALGRAYTQTCESNGFHPKSDTPLEIDLLNKLFPCQSELMVHAAKALESEFYVIKNLGYTYPIASDSDKARLIIDTREGIYKSLSYIEHALSTETEETLKSKLSEMFNAFIFFESDDEIPEPELEPIIASLTSLISSGLEKIGFDWRSAYRDGFFSSNSRKNKVLISYHKAAGEALLKSNNNPIKKIMALQAISELTSDGIGCLFKNNLNIISAIYKQTQNNELINYLDGKNRHACIEHDLGL